MYSKLNCSHDQLMQMLRPRSGVSEFIKLKHEKAGDAHHQDHHADGHVHYDGIDFLGLFAGAGVFPYAEQLKNAANRKNETDRRHQTDRHQNETDSIRCISVADETNARHTVAVHFA